jgi:hypothetical protein
MTLLHICYIFQKENFQKKRDGPQPFKNGAPDRIRTYDLCLRRATLRKVAKSRTPAKNGINRYINELERFNQKADLPLFTPVVTVRSQNFVLLGDEISQF